MTTTESVKESNYRLFHCALQQIAEALDLPAGSDTTTACVPAILALKSALSAQPDAVAGGDALPALPPVNREWGPMGDRPTGYNAEQQAKPEAR